MCWGDLAVDGPRITDNLGEAGVKVEAGPDSSEQAIFSGSQLGIQASVALISGVLRPVHVSPIHLDAPL
jgi:hypothetical protein